jgi:RimJ/RimL family protein N-acetyltransferase
VAPTTRHDEDPDVLTDLWPLFALSVRTPRLELHLPREPEIAKLAEVAAAGVHHPAERPFLTPWAEAEPQERARFVLQGHWRQLGSWNPQAWGLGLGVFLESRPVGVVLLRARDFPVVREVTTASWLGLLHQGKGYGTEARAGLLTLAFECLGAEAAVSEVFQDNHSSQAVSRKLGYEPDGISRDARGQEALVSDRLRLTRSKWESTPTPSVTVTGFSACRPLFGP